MTYHYGLNLTGLHIQHTALNDNGKLKAATNGRMFTQNAVTIKLCECWKDTHQHECVKIPLSNTFLSEGKISQQF
jgi:hypothetical protein